MKIKNILLAVLCAALPLTSAQSQAKKPNILVIFPDAVGWQNISAYGHGTLGYRTPHIDRIAREVIMFTVHHAQPSCTAGRAAVITGQYPIRSGMTTVAFQGQGGGLPAAMRTPAWRARRKLSWWDSSTCQPLSTM